MFSARPRIPGLVICLLTAALVTGFNPRHSRAAVIFHYRFETGPDGGAVSTAVDSGPNGLDSTTATGVKYTDNVPSSSAAGNFALDASGDLDYVEVPDNAAMHVTGSFTFELYARPNDPLTGDTTTTAHWIAFKKSAEVGSSINSYLLAYDRATGRFIGVIDVSASTSGTAYGVSDEGYEPGRWYHVALVFDKNFSGADDRLALYIDHQLVDELIDDLGDVYYSSEELVIGAANFGSSTGTYRRNFDGLIDEVRLTDEALDPSGFLPVSEPASVAFVALGGVALAAGRRRRR